MFEPQESRGPGERKGGGLPRISCRPLGDHPPAAREDAGGGHRRLKPFAASLMVLALSLTGVTAALAVAPNDNFANATVIDLNALPYTDTQDITDATTEANEPFYCSFTFQTIWYRFTSTDAGWLGLELHFGSYGADLSLFRDTGSGLLGLNLVTCGTDTLALLTQAGTTYYIQAKAPCCGSSGNLRLDLRRVPQPQPVASFYFGPSDPSIFDTIQFSDQSYDPGLVGIDSQAWSFGDGSTATGCCPTHHYATDGDRTVSLAVTTYDGRTASTSHVVSVKTHDVGIASFKTPQTAARGQTRQLTIGVRNTRYPETVHVELLKSVASSYQTFQTIGFLDQSVPVRPSNRTTDVSFSYTFSNEDAQVGKVLFKAVLSYTNYYVRDAFPADNEAISSPVKVSRSTTPALAMNQAGWEEEPELQLALLGLEPNPSRAGVDPVVRLSLPQDGTATLLVFDVSGRVVSRRELSTLGPGTHEVTLAWDRKPSPGVYWVRLTQAGQSVTSRMAVVQ